MRIPIFILILFALSHTGWAQPDESQPAPIHTRLHYPHFTLTIQNFLGFDPQFGLDTAQASYQYDEDGLLTGLLVKTDTLQLGENPDNAVTGRLMRIVPKNKADSFFVSYAFEQGTNEAIDYRSITPDERQKREEHITNWTDITAYYPMAARQRNLFKIPEYKDWGFTRAIKKKYQLHDTLVEIPGEYTTYVSFTNKERRLYQYWVGSIYLRVDRFVKGKRVERRLIRIWYNDSC